MIDVLPSPLRAPVFLVGLWTGHVRGKAIINTKQNKSVLCEVEAGRAVKTRDTADSGEETPESKKHYQVKGNSYYSFDLMIPPRNLSS